MSGPVPGNRRVPWPRITGTISRVISSTRSFSSSQRTRVPLPCTCSSPPGVAFSSPTAAARSPDRTVVSAQRGPVSVVDATYLGVVIQGHAMGWCAHLFDCSPRAGEELVGPPAEQERVGALVGPGDQRPGLVVARPLAHPPRSNPFLRSSSEAPPFPCITPSTVTCVMTVSFMIAVPFSPGRPSRAASHPCYERLRPDPTPPRGLLPGTFWHAGCQRSGSATVPRATALTSSCARPVQTSSGTRSIAKTLTSRPPR